MKGVVSRKAALIKGKKRRPAVKKTNLNQGVGKAKIY